MGLSRLVNTANKIFPSGGKDQAPHDSGIALIARGPQQSGVNPIASGSIIWDGDPETTIVDDDET